MNDAQLLRYSRHILLPEIDLDGQERLLAGHVLLIGAGGLGSPAALYLAAAGVGRLTVCDGDVVDLSNLQRQVLHNAARVGVNKAASARQTLAELNPDCVVTALEQRIDEAGLRAILRDVDVVVDGCDNFATRHAVNRACHALKKPLVSGAAVGFSGQLAVFDARAPDSPCYHCLFPDNGAPDATVCATFGVFAPLTGMIGSLQAGEALRLLLGQSSPLLGKLALWDARALEWRQVRVPRDPACPVCGRARAD